jgi:hypothetical protein
MNTKREAKGRKVRNLSELLKVLNDISKIIEEKIGGSSEVDDLLDNLLKGIKSPKYFKRRISKIDEVIAAAYKADRVPFNIGHRLGEKRNIIGKNFEKK